MTFPSAADALAGAIAESRPDWRAARLAEWLSAGRVDELRAALLAAFGDPRAETRRRAILVGSEALPADGPLREPLLAALADAVWGVREAAAVALARFPDDAIRMRLVELTLQDSSPLVRRAAAIGLGARIEPSRDYAAAIGHRFERQRIRACDALGFATSSADAVALLAPVVTDSHPKVRAAALRALARLDLVAVRPLLPQIVRRCAEAEPRVAAAAHELQRRLEVAT